MKAKLARLLSLIFSFILIFVMLIGCSSAGETAVDKGDESGDAVDATEEEDVDEAQEEAEPVYDFGGRTITYSAWWDVEPKAGSSETADKLIARMAEMEEKYNFKMAYSQVPWDQYLETYTASTLAGEPFTDLAEMMSYWFFPGLVVSKLVYPLSELEAFDFTEDKWEKSILEFATYKGTVYGMYNGRIYPRAGLFWNKTIFEREGLPNLYQIQWTKDWTWNKMLEIAKKATKDLDGDGQIDQWGLGGHLAEYQFVHSNNGDTVRFEDGRPIFALGEPNAIEALQFYQDLIHLHKVYERAPDDAPWDYPVQQFTNGKYAMFAYDWYITDSLKTNMQDDYGYVIFPMGPRADGFVSVQNECTLTVIPSTAKKPEEIAIVWDKRTDPFPDEDPDAWREGYESNARDKETVDTINIIQAQGLMKTDYLRCFRALEELSWSFMWQIRSGNKTPQVAIGEIAQQAQSILDDAFQQ